MKKLIGLFILVSMVAFVGCKSSASKRAAKEASYNRVEGEMEYERHFSKYVFAACGNTGKPYAMYSLARVRRGPTDGDSRYKVTFFNGPCKGKTGYTTDVITRTRPVGSGPLVKGTVVLRNFWNPRDPYNTEAIDRWHKGVIYDTVNRERGTVQIEFPRDSNDFMAPRENIFLHNIRYIPQGQAKDPRVILQ